MRRLRAARSGPPKVDGHWRVNAWVKQDILLGFRLGELEESGSGPLSFVDKDTFPARHFSVSDRVRVVPGGSSIRSGPYIAPGVICMPLAEVVIEHDKLHNPPVILLMARIEIGLPPPQAHKASTLRRERRNRTRFRGNRGFGIVHWY
ncbi:MAG: hypothetical protein WCG81_16910 [Candidatus Angelobacter sp.]